MPRKQSKTGRKIRRVLPKHAVEHVVIDNSRYPSTDEVAALLNVPPDRVRQLKKLAAETLAPTEIVR